MVQKVYSQLVLYICISIGFLCVEVMGAEAARPTSLVSLIDHGASLEAIKAAIRDGADVNEVVGSTSPVYSAFKAYKNTSHWSGYREERQMILECLLGCSPRLNQPIIRVVRGTQYTTTPFLDILSIIPYMTASENKACYYVQVLKSLLQKGANPNVPRLCGFSSGRCVVQYPLEFFLDRFEKGPPFVALLLEHGVDPSLIRSELTDNKKELLQQVKEYLRASGSTSAVNCLKQ